MSKDGRTTGRILEVGLDEISEYISEVYDKSLEFYAEVIADSGNNEDTIAEQVDKAVENILDDEGVVGMVDDDLIDKITDVVYGLVVDTDEDEE